MFPFKSILTVILLFSFQFGFSQKRFVSVSDETFVINSQTSISGKSTNFVEATHPPKAVGMVYRITSYSVGTNHESLPLIIQLKEYSPEDFAINNSLGRLVTKATSARPINYYVITNPTDITNFAAAKPFSYCKKFENRSELCYYTNECLAGSKIYFAFNNPDLSTGANIQFEVVAVVDESAEAVTKFPFVVTNTGNQQVALEWSVDGRTYQPASPVPSGLVYTYSFPKDRMHVLVRTNLFKLKTYQVSSVQKLKIYWNEGFKGWDLATE